MNVIKKKLNSERGASITWALLVFLVCAVVGSAVLVAGTAAAGRMSKLAENDQRYYAVTSTAGLLRDVLKEPIVATRTETGTSATFVPDDAVKKTIINTMMGWVTTTPSPSPSPSPSPAPASTIWDLDDINLSSPEKLDLTFSGSGTGGDAINSILSGSKGVDVELTINKDGSLLAKVSKDGYSMCLSFELDRSMQTDVNAGIATKKDTFQWKLSEAQKIVTQVPTPTATGTP